MGLLLGFITYFGWACGDIFGVFASRKIGAYRTTIFVCLFGFLTASLYVPFALSDVSKITPLLLALNLVMGSGYLMGNFLLNEGFKRSNASLVGVIVSGFSPIVLILSAIIFKDALTVKQALWTLVIFIGVLLCTINFNDFKKSKIFTDSGIKFACNAALIFSVYFTFFRVFSDVYGWFWPNYISFMSFPIALGVARYLFKIEDAITFPKSKWVLMATMLSGLLLRGGDIAFNYGVSSGMASMVAPIAGASPTLFITLSSLIFKDPITRQQQLGIGISIVGIILLSFFGK